MSSLATSVMNMYLISVFSMAAIAVVLSIALATTEVLRRRRLRLDGAAIRPGAGGSGSAPLLDALERLSGPTDDGGERVGTAVAVNSAASPRR